MRPDLLRLVRTIHSRDRKSGNFRKNRTHRRGDLLFEAVTLHRRSPYAVVLGFMFLNGEAATDSTEERQATLLNAHQRLKLFTGRHDPAGPEEQFERLYVVLVSADPGGSRFVCTPVGEPERQVSLESVVNEALQLVADRNPDFYEVRDGKIVKR